MNRRIKQYLTVALGSLISAVGINLFLVPHHMLSGGVSGIAMIIYFLLDWPIGVMVSILNIPLFFAAYRLLDREYVVGALFGMVVFAGSLDATRFLTAMNPVDDTLLAAVFGGVITGVGSGLIFRVNGSAGGLDIVAAIMKKFYALNMGSAGFAVNAVIMVIAAGLFGIKIAMYTLISMFMNGSVTDKVIEGFNRKKTVMIISESSQDIATAIFNEIGRGVTFLHGEGAYTRQPKNVVLVVLTLTQIAKVKFIVERVDPSAFMIVHDAAEVMGRGFTL